MEKVFSSRFFAEKSYKPLKFEKNCQKIQNFHAVNWTRASWVEDRCPIH